MNHTRKTILAALLLCVLAVSPGSAQTVDLEPSAPFAQTATTCTFLGSNATDDLAFTLANSVCISAAGAVVFNEGGADLDFRIECDTEANCFTLDGGTNAATFAGALTVTTGDLTLSAGNIIVSGTVDGVDIAARDHAVFTPTADPGVDHASLAGGAHITETAGSIALDAEVVKHSVCMYVETPVTDEDLPSIWRAPVAVTVTEIWCETDAGTVGLDITIDDGTPLAINGSDISCAVSTGTADSTFANSAAVADGNRLDMNIGTVATAVRLSVCIEYTVDDV